MIATGDPSKCDGVDSYAGSCTEWRTVTENTGSMTIGPGTVVGAGSGPGLTTFFLDDNHEIQGVFPRNAAPGSIAPPSWVVTRLAAGQVEGDIAAVQLPSGVVQVYGIQGGRLRHWEYTPGVNRLSATLPEVWEDQSPVETRYGIGLAYGFQSDMPGPQLYAAIPNAHAVPNTKAAPIEFARLDTKMVEIILLWFHGFVQRAVWTRIGHLQGHPTILKPSLAYQPFGDTLSEGRFYLSYSASSDGNVNASSWPVLVFTEGNVNPPASASSRRLKWQDAFETRFGGDILNTEFRGPDGRGGGVAIAVFGRSLVATTRTSATGINYFPAADGVFNTPLRDYNEVPLVLGNLRCSLTTNGEGPCAGE